MSRIISALGGLAQASMRARGLTNPLRAAGVRFYVSVANSLVSPVSGAIGNAAASEATYAMNRMATNHVPDVANAMKAFWAGQLGLAHVAEILANNGISFDNTSSNLDNKWKYYWSCILKHQQPMLEPDTILNLWHSHIITGEDCRLRLGMHGLTRPGDREMLMRNRGWYDLSLATDLWHQGVIDDAAYREAVWRAGIGEPAAMTHLLSQRSTAPVGDFADWWRSGWITSDVYAARLKREGISDEAQQALYLRQRTPVPLDMAIADYWQQDVPFAESRRRFQLHGYGSDEEIGVIVNRQAPYDPSEALRLLYRGAITIDQMHGYLATAGIVGEQRQDKWLAASRPIPGAGEIISLAVREAWDDPTAARFGYDQEFPPEFGYWMGQLGWDWSARTPAGPGAQGGPLSWAKAQWRAHWRPMEPTQGYQAFHALTPGRVAELANQIPGLRPFVWQDLVTVLKIQDYPPEVRKWLAAISYTVMDIRQARQVFAERLRGREWFREQLTRRGMSQADADALIDLEERKQWHLDHPAYKLLSRQGRVNSLKSVIEGYRIGVLSREEAITRLRDGGFNEDEAKKVLAEVEATENLALVKDAIARLKRGYLAGEFAPAEIAGLLAQFGLSAPAISRYVQRWNLARTVSRRMISTSQIVKWAGLGRITIPVATTRLANLGWTQPDTLLLLAEAQQRLKDAEKKRIEVYDLAVGKRTRQLEGVEKQAKQLRLSIQAQLRRETPLATLKKWVCQGLVSAGWAGDRLQAMGYPDPAVADYLRQWAIENEANKKCVPAAPAETPAEAPAETPPVAPAPTGKIGPPTGLETLEGGGKQIGE